MSDIDPIKLHSLFKYTEGKLFWKKNNKIAGSLKPTGYTVVEINNKGVMAHRIIWSMHNGSFDGQIDHINGNRSDNRIENLRLVNQEQNQWNRKINKNNTIGIKGIRLRKDNNKYEARLCVNKKRMVLGSFADLELAELVVIEARDKYHRKFANHG
jgi:hypothetical protein